MSPDTSEQHKALQNETATKINNAGWKQGSIFVPKKILAVPLEFNSDNECLMVITHSCIVVSRRFELDRAVEAMVCKKLSKFNPRSPEATGKNQRTLHLEIDSEEGIIGISCDINRRFFFDRNQLLDLSVQRNLSKVNAKKLATWLGRYYNRMALPDDLVDKLKLELLPKIQKCIEEKNNEGPLHGEIEDIYFYFNALKNGILFEVQFIFICTTQNAADYLDFLLKQKLNLFLNNNGKDGIYLSFLECKPKDQVFVSDLDTYDRFSDWDYLSNLEDVPIGKY